MVVASWRPSYLSSFISLPFLISSFTFLHISSPYFFLHISSFISLPSFSFMSLPSYLFLHIASSFISSSFTSLPSYLPSHSSFISLPLYLFYRRHLLRKCVPHSSCSTCGSRWTVPLANKPPPITIITIWIFVQLTQPLMWMCIRCQYMYLPLFIAPNNNNYINNNNNNNNNTITTIKMRTSCL
jgi:hypothetical protein